MDEDAAAFAPQQQHAKTRSLDRAWTKSSLDRVWQLTRVLRAASTVPHAVKHIEHEIVSDWPRIYLLKDFLTPEECSSLISLGKPLLQRSKVVPSVPLLRRISPARTSSSAFIDREDAPWLLDRVSATVLLQTSNIESPQICRDGRGARI